jgi:hypothetical protein
MEWLDYYAFSFSCLVLMLCGSLSPKVLRAAHRPT